MQDDTDIGLWEIRRQQVLQPTSVGLHLDLKDAHHRSEILVVDDRQIDGRDVSLRPRDQLLHDLSDMHRRGHRGGLQNNWIFATHRTAPIYTIAEWQILVAGLTAAMSEHQPAQQISRRKGRGLETNFSPEGL